MSRRLMILLSVFALAFAMLTPAAGATDDNSELELAVQKTDVAKSPTGSYIVVMKNQPLIAQVGRKSLRSGEAKAEQGNVKKKHERVLDEVGASASDLVNSYATAVDGFSAIISQKEAQKIANRDDVLAVYPDELRQPTTDSSPTFLRLDDRRRGPWAKGIDGEGVVIGVIDTGIWPEHPSFADDGSYTNPGLNIPCEFGNTAHNPNDVAFTCNNKLIGARQMLATYRRLIGAESFEYDSARDDNGHGTHTASTAGGNSGVQATIFGIDRGTISGIAPRAHIVMYKGLGALGGFSSDLAAAIDQAVADGVDVINYSIGSSSYAIGADDVAFLFAADAGVFVATSAGNSGPGAATIGSPATVPWVTSVGASTQERTFQGSVILGNGDEYFGASITAGAGPAPIVDSADLGNELCEPDTAFGEDVTGKIVLCKRGKIARVAKGEAVFNAGGVGMVLYNASDSQSEVTDNHFVPAVHINNTDGLAVKAYISSEGANATAEITEGVYTPVQGSVMASFSSRGPNPLAPDIIKPDVTAPGVNILAGNTPTPEPGSVAGELFQSISGTSMSSPHVAGMFALIKQAHPDWSAAMAKSALMTSARRNVTKEDGRTRADPFDMGAGHIVAVSRGHRGTPFDPGLVFDTGLLEYAGFTCGAGLAVFTSDTCASLESAGIPIDPSDLNVPSIGIAELAGSQTVTRTLTNVSNRTRTFRAKVRRPRGYRVKVRPKRIRLAPGESATVEITITNRRAKIDRWAFGRIIWRGGGYRVGVPIAVKATLFNAPATVEGSGTEGTTSFDVHFGYTGEYDAAPHGLSADEPVSGTISQDPDQTYPSSDDDQGGVNTFTFPVADSALARWSLTVPGDDDLDMYLLDPGGNLVAASTNGGTDELIELKMPSDGDYTLVVHGWSVPSQPLDYTLSYWSVPLSAGGGSLVIDDAPTSATLGETGTINLSWSGLTAGEHYVGAVSHSDGNGIIGLTVVEVDG